MLICDWYSALLHRKDGCVRGDDICGAGKQLAHFGIDRTNAPVLDPSYNPPPWLVEEEDLDVQLHANIVSVRTVVWNALQLAAWFKVWQPF